MQQTTVPIDLTIVNPSRDAVIARPRTVVVDPLPPRQRNMADVLQQHATACLQNSLYPEVQPFR